MSHVTSIRFDDELKNDIQFLAERYNCKPHKIMVENMKRAVKEEVEKIRFIEEAEQEYLKMKSLENYGLTMDQVCSQLGLKND
ncbi:hypothetical protein QJU23_07410 [Pasteurella atlantica]|uniref:Uncharacterized protein n=2 Tax=Pasteurellaceae TaxID=712 RepID=A0ACC6HN61_9PAST|nr:hypothetical protein [Pasteurella atlantica]MDP8052248.1 hypothetical protein [Pasteurella atlantica]MDP8105706.1 hypothetical protein [Pasteurella atlantica]MDP8149094.1 hypothetical protein [Pasteurella atlantica]